MRPFAGWVTVAMLAGMMSAHAQVYKWVGPDGKVQYGDTPPPPSATKVQPQTVAAPPPSSSGGAKLPYELAEAVRKHPVTLYTSANCSPCDTARTMLMSRGVPFTEKTVRSSEDVTHLREIRGDSQVPVMLLGTQKHQGYSATEWTEALTAAGYPSVSKLPKSYRNPPPEAAAPPKDESMPEAAASQPEAPRPAPPAPAGDAPPGFRF